MAERRPRYGVPSAGALGLRPGPGGQSWNFDLPEGRERASRLVASRRPFLLIGSPPCADWRGLNAHANRPKMDRREVARRAVGARVHMEFVAKLYQAQLERGARFPREHPASTFSRQEPCA
eukprot:2302360-Alexandrium_andersonii.AAC.1